MRIYIDTSVVGGYFDREFSEATAKFFAKVESGDLILVVSDLLRAELVLAPERVRDYVGKFTGKHIEDVSRNDEALDLADLYIAEKVVGATSLADCRHIAIATVYKVDVLVS